MAYSPGRPPGRNRPFWGSRGREVAPDAFDETGHAVDNGGMPTPPTQPPLPDAIEAALAGRVAALGPGGPAAAGRRSVEPLLAGLGNGRSPRDPRAADCCRAAVWLWHDCLDESHAISQGIDTPEGSWWHGIMHRREPDPDNAKYWFRRVGRHPVCGRLAAAVGTIVTVGDLALPRSAGRLTAGGEWDHAAFVDFYSAASAATAELARAIAALEWRLLFAHCHAAAWPDEPEVA